MAQEEVTNGAAGEKTVTFAALKLQLMVEAPKAADAVQFYKSVFGAVETSLSLYPKRKAEQELPHILSAELQIAGSTFIVSDSASVAKTEGLPLALCLETEDVEAAVAKAVAAGAVKEDEVTDGEGGACCGGGVQSKVKDPYGFTWVICSQAKKTADAEA